MTENNCAPSSQASLWTRWLLVSVVMGVLTACGDEASQVPPAANDPNLVTVNEALQSRLKVLPVSEEMVADVVRVAGKIDFDENRLARIGASVTGRVQHIDAKLGQTVLPGARLAMLNSSELTSQQLAYLKASAQAELQQRNAERAKALFEADAIGAAELQKRQSEARIAQAELRAAADQLKLLGVDARTLNKLSQAGSINSLTPIVNTISGVVVERKIVQGQVVQPADPLFTVADLTRLWAVAQIPEQQIGLVQVGQNVSVEIPALNNQKMRGKLIYVGQLVNPETRTVLVRTELDNAEGRLKPAMLATMLIQSKGSPQRVVPSAAVVRENDDDYVYVEQKPGTYRLTKVKLVAENNQKRVVQAGLQGNERIVVEGSFHLHNEKNRQEQEGA